MQNQINEQNNNVYTDGSSFEQSISFQDIFESAVKHWHWFALSLLCFLGIGIFYLLRTSPVYHREATILVKDARKGGGASELAAFGDITGIATRRNVDNELYVIQANRLMIEVVNRLNLTTNYTTKSGLRKVDLYGKSPIATTFIDDLGGATCKFDVTLGENEVVISEFSRPASPEIDEKADERFTVTAPYGDTISLPNGRIVIEKTLYMSPDYIGRDINCSKSNVQTVATRYRSATKMSVANKMSSIINLSLNDVVPQRAEDVLNTLINVYNDDAVIDKQIIGEATAEFISERLKVISEELNIVDNNIKAFKAENNIVDLRTETKQTSEEMARYEAEIAVTSNQLAVAKYIKEYLSDSSKSTSLIPIAAFEGGYATQLASQIGNYNDLILHRDKLMTNGENNPIIRNLEASISATRNAILASLASHISALEIRLQNLEQQERRITSRIGSVPAKEQEFLSIARQQKIKEELYLYLLNKSEENAISLAITERTARIVDNAFGPSNPISPNKVLIMLIMAIFGCGLPLLCIYLSMLFNTKVQGKHDIVKYTKVPYLGDIPIFTGNAQRSIAVRENSRDKVSEAFKILRTNMSFMSTGSERQQVILVTSSNAHAGKTFVSMNLGMTLAFSGNRVLMIDLDLRRRTLSKHMGQRSNPNGITKYISKPETSVEDIISKSNLHPNFDFIYAGLQPPNPAEMLMSSRLDKLIEECRGRYDYILIDSVPALIIADALIISRVSDLSIYVVREGLLDRRQLPDINSLYTDNKLRNMCIVLNGASETRHSYGYGYRYQYDPEFEGKQPLWKRVLRILNPKNLFRH
ncbi:MAG: polysaccharide biosynthesis tyrosine autokinase [Alistipes sp.]|nr:polysaccharide biosynthesis tyrosine autokinase [Alistipes sp.]